MKAVFTGFLLLVMASAVQAQTAQTATIGDTLLQLGTGQGQVFEILQRRFVLRTTRDINVYNVFRLGPNGRTAGGSLGTIEFQDRRLYRVVASIGTLQGEEASTAMRRLISEFAQAQAAGGEVSVETDIRESVSAITSWMYFRLPEKLIQIAVYEPKEDNAPVTVDITEQYVLAK